MDCKKSQVTCNFQCRGKVRILNAVYEDILLMPQWKITSFVRFVNDHRRVTRNTNDSVKSYHEM